MWIYSTAQEILDALFFAKRKILAILIIVLITALIWVVIPLCLEYIVGTPRTNFIQTHDIVVPAQETAWQYGYTETHHYALFVEQYIAIARNTTCPNFNRTDFTTWCDAVPQNY